MDLELDFSISSRYVNNSQVAREVTESWAEKNLPCFSCTSPALTRMPNNSRGHDFFCPLCEEKYQLKSQRNKFGKSLAGASYSATIEAIQSDQVPNWILLQYDDRSVLNLVLISRVSITIDCISARRPLKPTARRAGWVGCVFALSSLAPKELLWIVRDSTEIPAAIVRTHFNSSILLAKSSPERGWALSVLRILYTLEKSEFRLSDLYAFHSRFQELYPKNNNIKAKLRQQLQILRDSGYVEFLGRGSYRLISS